MTWGCSKHVARVPYAAHHLLPKIETPRPSSRIGLVPSGERPRGKSSKSPPDFSVAPERYGHATVVQISGPRSALDRRWRLGRQAALGCYCKSRGRSRRLHCNEQFWRQGARAMALSPMAYEGFSGDGMPTAFFTIAEACEVARISRSRYYQLHAAGLGPRETRLPGRRPLIAAPDLDAWLDAISATTCAISCSRGFWSRDANARSRGRNSTAFSLLRHPGLAQSGEISGFEQGADLRYPEILGGLQMGDA